MKVFPCACLWKDSALGKSKLTETSPIMNFSSVIKESNDFYGSLLCERVGLNLSKCNLRCSQIIITFFFTVIFSSKRLLPCL